MIIMITYALNPNSIFRHVYVVIIVLITQRVRFYMSQQTKWVGQ